jgi:hypothetical protein
LIASILTHTGFGWHVETQAPTLPDRNFSKFLTSGVTIYLFCAHSPQRLHLQNSGLPYLFRAGEKVVKLFHGLKMPTISVDKAELYKALGQE